MQILQINSDGGVEKYLGFPEHFGRSKKELFTFIVDKIKHKAASWSTKIFFGWQQTCSAEKCSGFYANLCNDML